MQDDQNGIEPPILNHPPQPPEHPEDEEKAADKSWAPLDLSHGIVPKAKLGDTRSFKYNEKKQLKELGTVLSPEQRKVVTDELAKLTKGGLGARETRKKINELVEKGTLNKLEARKIIGKLRARK